MKNRKALKWIIYSILFFTGLSGINSANAQTIHPVTASLQLVPPYSVYLADYAAPGNDKLRVILTLNDLSQPSYTVRLRIKVEMNGRAIMQTDPVYRGSAITLMPGMPQIITGSQLNEYLVSDHLQFMNGFSRENYERTKALPEGAYRICVTAYDYNRSDDVAISNDGCNIFFFQKNEAPLLNFPLCNSRVDRKDPQFLSFTWSIRNTPSFVTGSSGTGYRFELFEVRPAGSNPEYIVRSSTPVYTATTDNAMLLYGPGEPRLQDSMQYVWRVQAYDKDGRDAYQNNGYSQACVFTYGGLDPFVVGNIGKPGLMAEALGERSGKWWWHISNGKTVDGWNLQYRKRDTTGSKNNAFDWNKKYLTDTLFHLFNLEPDNTYEAQVQPVIRGIAGSYSETVVFRTMPKRVYECGKNDTANFGMGAEAAGQPLNSAIAGMIVRVGDFEMQLLEVSGGNGRFSGYGAITTPLLGLSLNVKFTDVTINDKLQLTQGEAVALTEGIDSWIKDRTKVKNDVEDIKDWSDKMPDFETASLSELKDFATELLGISEGVWNDTYVYTEEERKQVKDALAEIKAAMQELDDSDPSNDAAAEKKLRDTLKKVEPLLEKLSNNIGKGVLVQLGLIKDKLITDGLTDIKKQVEAELQKLAFEYDEAQRTLLAQHGPHVFGYKGNDNDKDDLAAKKKVIEKLLTDNQARQFFIEIIERNNDDNNYLADQEKTLESLLEKQENKSKVSKELLSADNWKQVIVILNKYLDKEVETEKLLKGSRFIAGETRLISAQDEGFYLDPAGKPLNLTNWKGYKKITPYGQSTNLYVIVGLIEDKKGKLTTFDAKVNADNKFVGYVSPDYENYYLDIKDIRLDNLTECTARLPYAVDACSYKTLIVDKWKVTDNKTIDEVQKLLSEAVQPAGISDKSGAIGLSKIAGQKVNPACEGGGNSDGDGIQSSSEVIINAPSIADKEAMKRLLENLGFKINGSSGFYFDRIIVTDENIDPTASNNLTDIIADNLLNKKNYRCLWIKLNKQGQFSSVETFYSKDVDENVKKVLDIFKDYIKYLGERETWKKVVDVISNGLKQLGDFIRKARIPEKYYNPEHPDYNSKSFILFLFKQASTATAVVSGLEPIFLAAPGIGNVLIKNANDPNSNIGLGEVNFAFYCGVWNGLVEQVASLPEGAGWLLDIITDKDHARRELIAEMQRLHKDAEKEGGLFKLLGKIVQKSFTGPNATLNAHSYGVATSQAITIVLSITKIGKAGKIATLLNNLDLVGHVTEFLMLPAVKFLGWSTKVVIKGTSKLTIVIVKGGLDLTVEFLKGSTTLNKKYLFLNIPLVSNVVGLGEEIIRKLRKLEIKKFLKDSEGNYLKDEEGRYIVEVEDAEGNKMHATASELEGFTQYIIGKLCNTNLAGVLQDELTNNPALRRLLEENEELLEAWEVLQTAGYPALSKNADELEKVRKLIKDNNLTLAAARDAVRAGQKLSLLGKLNNLPFARDFVNTLDEAAEAALINKINNLSQTQLDKLNTFFKNRPSPSGFGLTDFNFTATRNINGQQVSINFTHGFPDFHNTPYCPSMRYPDGTSGKFKFEYHDLKGVNPDFKNANEALLNKFGMQQGSPKNAAGFYQTGNYRWNGRSAQFELQNASGIWEKYTWHHFEDGKTMFPVLSDVHSPGAGGFVHPGGHAIIDGEIKDLFEFTGF